MLAIRSMTGKTARGVSVNISLESRRACIRRWSRNGRVIALRLVRRLPERCHIKRDYRSRAGSEDEDEEEFPGDAAAIRRRTWAYLNVGVGAVVTI